LNTIDTLHIHNRPNSLDKIGHSDNTIILCWQNTFLYLFEKFLFWQCTAIKVQQITTHREWSRTYHGKIVPVLSARNGKQ